MNIRSEQAQSGPWATPLREWLHVRFGGRLRGEEMDAALENALVFQKLWEPLLGETHPNALAPFSHLLPPLRGQAGHPDAGIRRKDAAQDE